MPRNPPENMPRITPALCYDDPAAALNWLADAFGFETRISIPGSRGEILHAEMQIKDGVILVGPASAKDRWKSPKSLEGSVTQGIYVYVDDVDAHCSRARKAGAKILSGPEDMFYGDRKYEVEDLEGHLWTFAQHVRDVSPEEMKPPE